MRAVSFVEKLYFDVKGNIMKNAIALGDVDNDKANELVVGNILGDVYIFKGSNRKPWKRASGVGMVAVILIGDAMNNKKNCLVTVSGEGPCYVFDVPDTDVEIASCDDSMIKHCHEQRLPANTKVALLADIDGDGNNEIVIALTDRVVRSYRWTYNIGENEMGTFVPLNKWEFANQIGCISLHSNPDRSRCLLVSQPGGTYVRLQCSLEVQSDEDDDAMSQCLEYHPLTSTKMRNPNITTEILGNVLRKNVNEVPYFVVSTLDGTLMLVDEEKIIWSLQVDHQLFGLSKMDITGDGQEEIIVTSWDGQTYIINHERQSVRFQFEESIGAFAVGSYSVDGCSDLNVPCFIYVTFNDSIVMYHNVALSQITASSLVDVVTSSPGIQESLEKLNVDVVTNSNDLQRLNQWCLYEQPKESNYS